MKPYVICHMAMSIDGRITTDRWDISDEEFDLYEQLTKELEAQAWMCGRSTMEEFAGGALEYDASAPRDQPRVDFVASGKSARYAISLDSRGLLAWETNEIDGDPIVTVLSELASDSTLARLRELGISYLFAGRSEIDLSLALEKIAAQFGIRRVLLEGGGVINGAFLRANLVDELSILVVPMVDGTRGTPTLFDADANDTPLQRWRLVGAEPKGAIVWMRYLKE